MGIVNHYRLAGRAGEGLQPAPGGTQGADADQSFLPVCPERQGGAIYRKNIVSVVLAYESGPYLGAVQTQQHPFHTLLHNAGAMVSSPAQRIAHNARFRVLDHYHTVAVICVDYCNGAFRQPVEEELLASEVFGEAAVVVEVVVGKV